MSLVWQQLGMLVRRLHFDWPLLMMLAVLIGVGLVVLYSASGDLFFVERQIFRVGVGALALVVLAHIDPRFFRLWSLPLFLAGLILLVLVLVMGTGAMGAKRWLGVPGLFMFQPSEIMKIAVPAMLAWWVTQAELPPRLSVLVIALVCVLLPAFLVVQQPDLGTAILIFASGLFVLFLAGISRWILALGFLSLAAATPLLWFTVLREYQKQRILTLFNPESDPLGAGWNIIQSKTALGSGGWSGKGYLQGTQSQLEFLPESHTDFVLSVMGEEFGFIGLLLLLCLYLAITVRALTLSLQARNTYGRVLGGALSLVFFLYVLVNVGMVSGILPIVGIPLPMISYGGTSLVTLMAGFGIIMSVGTHAER